MLESVHELLTIDLRLLTEGTMSVADWLLKFAVLAIITVAGAELFLWTAGKITLSLFPWQWRDSKFHDIVLSVVKTNFYRHLLVWGIAAWLLVGVAATASGNDRLVEYFVTSGYFMLVGVFTFRAIHVAVVLALSLIPWGPPVKAPIINKLLLSHFRLRVERVDNKGYKLLVERPRRANQ